MTPLTDSSSLMARAIELARIAEGRTAPNPPVGALVVRNGQIIGQGFHPRAGEPHAEIFALREAAEAAAGADLYVTLEPCSHHGRTPPCADALIKAGIRRVFVGTRDPNPQVSGRGLERLRRAGIEVFSGILEEECRRLIAPFACHITRGRPFVILKSAMTLDGRTATACGDSRWVSGPESRFAVHRLRDRVDAIMVGIGTVLADDPMLTTRLPEGGRDPLRIVLDTHLRIPPDARLLSLDSQAPTWIFCCEEVPPLRVRRLEKPGVQVYRLPCGEEGLDLSALLAQLGREGIQSLLLEGGATLNGSMLRAGLVDRLMFFLAPKLHGGRDGFGVFAGAGASEMAQATPLGPLRLTRYGEDVLIEAEVEHVHGAC